MKVKSLKQIACPYSLADDSTNKCSGILADAFQERKASHLAGLLRNQRGFTLIEAMVVTVVLAAMIATIYTGVMYAEKQTRMNYRHRVATLIASGEVEKQYTMYMKVNMMRPFTGKQVVIDDTSENIVRGAVTVSTKRDVEYNITKQYGYTYVTAEVSWIDPASKNTHKVKVREDFYDVEGKVNN
ncbi:MAG: hypothetical protein CVU50_06315 [Candidatus Cloacimonetes bacterium HGW-Cloacimonetes-3]|jgi:prepilin-type N-terminal cleavage/methylation domain-containing protein|nr:MAG: hypothetical protein CVU50_06315 [Candidatus Cloacimonetes bacterium HGW-Cloacimonetes-3]